MRPRSRLCDLNELKAARIDRWTVERRRKTDTRTEGWREKDRQGDRDGDKWVHDGWKSRRIRVTSLRLGRRRKRRKLHVSNRTARIFKEAQVLCNSSLRHVKCNHILFRTLANSRRIELRHPFATNPFVSFA